MIFSLIQIQLRPDPDPTHIIRAYLKIIFFKTKILLKKKISTNYLLFSIKYYSPTVHCTLYSRLFEQKHILFAISGSEKYRLID